MSLSRVGGVGMVLIMNKAPYGFNARGGRRARRAAPASHRLTEVLYGFTEVYAGYGARAGGGPGRAQI